MDKKQKIALVLNATILLFVIVGSIMTFAEIYFVETTAYEHGVKMLKFFTVQSNIFAGITALIYLIAFISAKKTNKESMPMFVRILKYIATIDLVITFLVVALFLGFIVEDGYFSLFVNSNLLFHFLIPVLNFVSFVFFENAQKFKFQYVFLGLVHLALYSIFYLIVVLCNFSDGGISIQYDWYGFAQKGLFVAFVCAVVVLGIGYFIAYMIYRLNNKKCIEIK